MPEQTFRSPNFFEREIDLSAPRASGPLGTPAGVVGTANKGPAFVPVTVGNFDDFVAKFGNLDSKKFGPYAVNEFLKHKSALTYLRVLGAGANSTEAQINTTVNTGRVTAAGFYFDGTAAADTAGRHTGIVQFLVATHNATTDEAYGVPMFTDNASVSNPNATPLIRGMIMTPSTARVMILTGSTADPNVFGFKAGTPDDTIIDPAVNSGKFKLVISSTLGNSYWNTDGFTGIRVFTASFNPSDADYFGKVLNTNPDKFVQEQHYLYADFPVDAEVAVAEGRAGILSGSHNVSSDSGDPALPFRKAYGAFDTRYQTPQTSWFISQPYGSSEYDLFKFESLDDGEYANTL